MNIWLVSYRLANTNQYDIRYWSVYLVMILLRYHFSFHHLHDPKFPISSFAFYTEVADKQHDNDSNDAKTNKYEKADGKTYWFVHVFDGPSLDFCRIYILLSCWL